MYRSYDTPLCQLSDPPLRRPTGPHTQATGDRAPTQGQTDTYTYRRYWYMHMDGHGHVHGVEGSPKNRDCWARFGQIAKRTLILLRV